MKARRLATTAALVGATALLVAGGAASDGEGALQGPPDASVWPTTSTIVLEYHEPWTCADCDGRASIKVATDPTFSNLVSDASGTCPAGTAPSCPIWTWVGPYPPGTYYWATYVLFANGEEHRSPVRSFSVATPSAVPPVPYSDPAGDAGGAPDISGTTVSYDPAAQRLAIRVSIPGYRFAALDEKIFLFLDTDQNAGSGDLRDLGADYYFVVRGSNHSYGFYRWDGKEWVTAPTTTTFVGQAGVEGQVFGMNRDDIGGSGVTGFNFWAEADKNTTSATVYDLAPDASVWNYQLPAPAVTAAASIASFAVTAVPALPTAGRAFTLAVPSVTLASGAKVQPTTVRCTALLAGKALHGTGKGGCTFHLPSSSAGQLFHATVTAGYKGAARTGTVAYRIRRP